MMITACFAHYLPENQRPPLCDCHMKFLGCSHLSFWAVAMLFKLLHIDNHLQVFHTSWQQCLMVA